MKLSQLLKTIPFRRIRCPEGMDADPEIGSIHCRADRVEPGGLFVAVSGFKADGHDFIDEAIGRGAVAVVAQKPVDPKAAAVEVENSRKALAVIASRFYGNPSESLVILGVTGTNGKTTTTFLIESILQAAGIRTGVIGTINYRYAGKVFENPVTTPESLDLQRILWEMRKAGITHVVMEISSHAIDLHRVDGCCVDVGIFTNLSRDHLDYHPDMESYWSCKKRLFTETLRTGAKRERTRAVINCDDERGRELFRLHPENSLSTGTSENSQVRPVDCSLDLSGIHGKIVTPKGTFDFRSKLVGAHNLENLLSATGAGIALGLAPEPIRCGIETLSAVPGRLERVPGSADRFVYVDYAHTPDALEHALCALGSLARGRIICVFGCGGDRDRLKRPQMGEIAARRADLCVVTSDNPRTEDPLLIIEGILEGVRPWSPVLPAAEVRPDFSGKISTAVSDRRSAIAFGISVSRPGDTILIAGKGHETYQILGHGKIAFDDREEARRVLAEIEAVAHAPAGHPKP